VRRSIGVLRGAGMAFWGQSGAWALGIALVIGIPTVLIPNDLFRRMTPTRWWDFVFWGVTALLSGAVLAARVLPGAARCKVGGQALAGYALTFLAVGCPLCNKIVVGVIGASGALAYFAPIQPLLGSVSVAVLALTLHRTLHSVRNDVGDPSDGSAHFMGASELWGGSDAMRA
jgi:hypothetical protein